MRISAALPHGVSALFAASARRRRELESALVERLEHAGFEEVVLPIVDYLEPYEPLLTPASRRELYQFVDRDGELLALRADFTPMLARLIAPRLHALDLPLAVFYRGDVVRFQEERPGRLREFYQLGAELLGVPGAEGEERMLRLFLELLDRMAAGNGRRVDLVLGLAGALDGLLRAAGGGAELAQAVARRDRDAIRRAAGRESSSSEGSGDTPLAQETAARALLEVVENGVPEDPAVLGAVAERRMARLQDLSKRLAVDAPSVRLEIDLAEFAGESSAAPAGAGVAGDQAEDAVWGRSYYDGVVFRAYMGSGALPVGGGGRYDRLFRALGAEVPAVGFSIGLDRLSQGLAQGLDGNGAHAEGPDSEGGER